jgi:5-methylcytosine-specific restriction endonuclease McrA
MKLVFVEREGGSADGPIIRIYRGLPDSATWFLADGRRDAVAEVRRQVFERSGGQCEYCGKLINWHFHMHEKIPRGKGGEVSLVNCVALCASCHIGSNGEHGKRRPRFGESLLGSDKP